MNFADPILTACRANPRRLALRAPRWQHGTIVGDDSIDYGTFATQVAGWQASLSAAGYRAGDRIVLLVPPAIALYTLLTAMLSLGIVPVLIERGMSRQRIAQSLRASGARAIIGECAMLRRWWLFPAVWRLRRHAVDGSVPGVRHLVPAESAGAPAIADCNADDHGIITFTSGSTGAPKGADRTHGSLLAQHRAIRAHWPDADDDIDFTCFPVLVLHNLCCGITTVLPHADLAAPGNADPARIAAQVLRERITRLSAAPAFLARLVAHCRAEAITFPAVRSVVIGGATLSRELAQHCIDVFPNAHCRVVYGSTEAEPIADIDLPELVAHWHDHPGHLVGKPAHAATVAVVDRDATLATEADVARATLADGAVGELLVAGDHVLRGYLDNPQATRDSKIPRADGTVWHRTGDTGFRDPDGRLWLVGRCKDAIIANGVRRDVFPVEKEIDALPGVARSALVQVDGKPPALFYSGDADAVAIARVLADAGLPGLALHRIPSMPVDGRHNSKIDRPALRALLAGGKHA